MAYSGRYYQSLAAQDSGSLSIPATVVQPGMDAAAGRRWVVYDVAEDEAVEPAGGDDAAWTWTIISFNRSHRAQPWEEMMTSLWGREG